MNHIDPTGHVVSVASLNNAAAQRKLQYEKLKLQLKTLLTQSNIERKKLDHAKAVASYQSVLENSAPPKLYDIAYYALPSKERRPLLQNHGLPEPANPLYDPEPAKLRERITTLESEINLDKDFISEYSGLGLETVRTKIRITFAEMEKLSLEILQGSTPR